jgi:hypothetical protein
MLCLRIRSIGEAAKLEIHPSGTHFVRHYERRRAPLVEVDDESTPAGPLGRAPEFPGRLPTPSRPWFRRRS